MCTQAGELGWADLITPAGDHYEGRMKKGLRSGVGKVCPKRVLYVFLSRLTSEAVIPHGHLCEYTHTISVL